MTLHASTTHRGPTPWNRTLLRSRLFDALSLLLPAGETFFVATLEQWLAQPGDVPDARLRAELGRFIREERAHQRAHDRYNAALIARTPAASAAALRAARAADQLAGWSLPSKMALVAAFEHLTTVLSREILERPYLMVDDASLQSLTWRWHAREELDHSHIAMEAAAQYGIGRARLVLALVLATGYLAFDVLQCTRALCRCDVAAGASRWKLLADACSFAIGGLPSLARMALRWWDIVMPARVSSRAT
ncbi:metal-dependent hydrolase [Paraburkholderia sp. CI3]|uniref:metal-dependent hydrolase n=1 Tax=Paraburkholderia sp. CI3 TaxID=2991060 RepID=UPI003D1A9FF2